MGRQRSNLRNRLEFGAYRVACAAAHSFGPRTLGVVGGLLGETYAIFGGRRSRILRFNLSSAFPELDSGARRRLGRAVARHFGRVTLDALRIQRLSPDELLREVQVEGKEHLLAAQEEGHGVFVLSAHVGSWEVAGLTAGLLVPEGLAVIHRPLDNPLLESELLRFRDSFGNRSLGKRSVMREILRELRSAGTVGILIDQRARSGEAVKVPFFGRPAWTHPILARLALRTHAPVVPLWGLWDGPGRYTVRFEAPMTPEPGEDDVALTARYVARIEAVIRERPEQWLWYHDRWRDERVAAQGGRG